MPKIELLPGVTTKACPPPVVCDARAAMRKARHKALIREGLQLTLLLVVDSFLLRWPEARLPYLDRHGSINILLGLNIAMLGAMWITRALPRWNARRIATTWCARERSRYRA